MFPCHYSQVWIKLSSNLTVISILSSLPPIPALPFSYLSRWEGIALIVIVQFESIYSGRWITWGEFYLSGSNTCISRRQDTSLTGWQKIQFYCKTAFVQQWSTFHHTYLPIQSELVQHNPTGSILRITGAACSWKTYTTERSVCKWFGTVQNLSAGTRPYHSEKQEEGRQKTDATTVRRGEGKLAHMVLVQTGGGPPNAPPRSDSVPLNLRGLTVHTHTHIDTHTPSVTWPLEH